MVQLWFSDNPHHIPQPAFAGHVIELPEKSTDALCEHVDTFPIRKKSKRPHLAVRPRGRRNADLYQVFQDVPRDRFIFEVAAGTTGPHKIDQTCRIVAAMRHPRVVFPEGPKCRHGRIDSGNRYGAGGTCCGTMPAVQGFRTRNHRYRILDRNGFAGAHLNAQTAARAKHGVYFRCDGSVNDHVFCSP